MPAGTRDPEAWEMGRELMRVLQATGRYSATGLAEACSAIGRPHARETISRVLNGQQPPSYGLVEDLALAAGKR
jgi:hypothetical protein